MVAPRRSPLGRKRIVTLAELHGQPLVALSPERSAIGAQLAALLVRAGIEPRTTATTQLTATVSALVLRGMGIGVVDELTAGMHVAHGGVARLLDAPVTMQLRFVQAAASSPSEAIRHLVSQCERAIDDHKFADGVRCISTLPCRRVRRSLSPLDEGIADAVDHQTRILDGRGGGIVVSGRGPGPVAEPRRPHRRTLPAGRWNRPPRAAGRAASAGQARSNFHRRRSETGGSGVIGTGEVARAVPRRLHPCGQFRRGRLRSFRSS